jgi:hypothetical protein
MMVVSLDVAGCVIEIKFLPLLDVKKVKTESFSTVIK